MKKIDEYFKGARGSIPPQLFKYIDMSNMPGETVHFVDYMNNLADYLHKIPATDAATAKIDMPPKLYGQDVTLEYIGHGTVGTVYKMKIGDNVFALKVNRVDGFIEDLVAMDKQKKARSLINRQYIGSTFDYDGHTYSWILSNYIESDYENSFVDAKEKLFYAAMTKGLKYSDMHPFNTKNGQIIDTAGIIIQPLKLTRIEIDMVKKFLHLMRTNDMDAFKRLAEFAILHFPNVIKYIYVKMNIYQMEIPMRLQPYKRKMFEYNRRVRAAYNPTAQMVER